MIKRFLATLILISMLSSIGSFVPAVYSEENVVYSETFENTSVGELPPNVTSNIGAALGDAGYVAVAENAKAEGKVLESRHQTTKSGTNSALISLPTPVTGSFALDVDLIFGDLTIEKEMAILMPDGSQLFAIGLQRSGSSYIGGGKRLYYELGSSAPAEISQFDFDITAGQMCHFRFDVDRATSTLLLTMDERSPVPFHLDEAGIAQESIGIGTVRISTRYTSKVSGTNRYFAIDNITVVDKIDLSANLKPDIYRLLPDIYVAQGEAVSTDLQAYFYDPEEQPLSFAADVGTIDENGVWSYTAGDDLGVFPVTITAQDPEGMAFDDSFNIVVNDASGKDSLIYFEDFETTPLNKFPSNVDLTIAATYADGGGVSVVKDGDNRLFRMNHKVTQSGTNSAAIHIPCPGYGDFVMETDIYFSDAVTRKELGLYNPDGSLLMTVGLGLGSNPNSAAPETLAASRKLYYTVGGTKTVLEEYEPGYTEPYHLMFSLNAADSTMLLAINGGEAVPVSLEDSGLLPDKFGLGSLQLSSYFNNAVSSNRFVSLDNIVIRADYVTSGDDRTLVEQDAAVLSWEQLSSEPMDAVSKSLNLRTEGAYGSTITWSSSDESVISGNGMVLQQTEAKTVTLMAVFQHGAATTQKIFKVTVLPKVPPVYGDWYFEDFESYTEGESVVGKPGWSESTNPPTNKDTGMTLIPDPAGTANQMLKLNCNHTGIQSYSGYTGYYDFDETFSGDFEISFDFMVGQIDTDSRIGIDNSSDERLFQVGVSSGGSFSYIVDGKTTTLSGIKPVANKRYQFKLLVSESTRYVAWYIDDVLAATLRQTENVAQNYDVGRIQFYAWVKKVGTGCMYVDNLTIRENLTAKLTRYFEEIHFDELNDGAETDFPLPEFTPDGTPISWKSNHPAIVPEKGMARVTRPAPDEGDVDVSLTATVSEGEAEVSRDYIIKVLRRYTDAEAVLKDAEALSWSAMSTDPEDAVISSVSLPNEGRQGSIITWTASNGALVMGNGTAAPARGNADAAVTLTALVTRGGSTATKEFELVVLRKLPVNLAEGKEFVEQSSQIATMPVSYAVDNNFLTQWSTLYADDKPYVIIDLGVKQPVDSLLISERSKNISSFQVSASNNKLSYTPVYSFQKTAFSDLTETEIQHFNAVEARYFKIEFERVQAEAEIRINEIQLYNSELTDEQSVQFAAQIFDIFHKERITENVILPLAGSHGTALSYRSSDESVFTSDGTVNRRDDTVTVNLTVTFTKGSQSTSKTIELTVLGNRALAIPDNTNYQPFNDVYMPMSNEEFFGVWDSTRNIWDINSPGVFNYNVNPEMQKIGEYVKRGDYDTAKSALVHYYKTRDIGYEEVQSSTNYALADVYINNILSGSHTYIASAKVPQDWGEVQVDVSSLVKKPGAVSMFIMQKYKHEAEVEFYAKEAGEHSAVLEIEYGGRKKNYPVSADTYVSPDTNIYNNYGSEKRLYVKETAAANPDDAVGGYGNLWTSDTKRTYLRFDINGLDENTVITGATLKLYGRASGGAEVLIWQEGTTGWDENSYNWVETVNDVYSWNGGKVDWVYPSNKTEGGVVGQLPRFYLNTAICGAYGSTGDEYYAYHSIRQILDFIEGTKDYIGYGNLQASGIRGGSLVISFNQLLNSKHLTEDAAISMIQYLWQLNQTLSLDTYFRADHNHGIFANRGLMRLTMYFTEFAKHPQWKKLFIERYNILLNTLISADGAYREATTHYTGEVIKNLMMAINESKKSNFELDPFFNKKLKDLTMFLAHTLSPDGTDPGYGDAEHGGNHRATIRSVAEALDDEQLRYLYTNGTKGEYPGFTSKLYPDGRYLVMRDGYNEDAWIMQTNWGIGDGRSHTHPDNLSLTMYAYGKYLVADPGRYTYTDNKYSNWLRQSTQSHNVVDINETTQGIVTDKMNTFVTNEGFDYFSGTSTAVKDKNAKPYNYLRNVLFSKGKFFVVSDKVTPDSGNLDVNKYDQNWHFLPESNPRYFADTGMMKTNFKQGAQLIIAQADKESVGYETVKKYFSWGNKSVTDAEYAQFTQEKAGTVTFDTVLYPVPAGDKTTVKTDRIELDVPKETATALSITVDDAVNKYENVYYLTYEDVPSQRTIGDLTYDGRLMLVEYSSTGKVSSISMADGSRLTSGGRPLVSAKNKIEDIFINYDWDNIVILSNSLTEDDLSGLEIASERNVASVTFNGKIMAYYQNGNVVTLGSVASAGDNRVEVKQEGDRNVGTVTSDYESVLQYSYQDKIHTVSLSVPAQTKISGTTDWDGAMPKLQTGSASRLTEGKTVQVIVFDNKDLTFDTPYAVKIQKDADVLLYQQNYKKLTSGDSASVQKTLKPGEVGVYCNAEYVTLFAYHPVEMILYKEMESPPSLPSTGSSPSGGGGGSGGGDPGATIKPTPPPAENKDPDVPVDPKPPVFQDIEGHWAQNDIERMASVGVVKGSDDNFYPDHNITRAEFTALLVRLLAYEKVQYTQTFSDVSDGDWFADDVQTAHQHGLISGYDNAFRPNDQISREEIAVILSRVMTGESDRNVLDKFADKGEVSEWALDGMAEAIQSGIISGLDETTLSPKAFATRAMAITMLARLYDTVDNE